MSCRSAWPQRNQTVIHSLQSAARGNGRTFPSAFRGCARQFEADFIVTRNVKDYKLSRIKAISPSDFVGKFLRA
jgi:hypothetical protein